MRVEQTSWSTKLFCLEVEDDCYCQEREYVEYYKNQVDSFIVFYHYMRKILYRNLSCRSKAKSPIRSYHDGHR